MPRFGSLDVAAALAAAPAVAGFDAPSWEMPDATLVQVNWEVDDDAALGLTPPALHPSIPPYVSVFGGRYPDSPVGSFTLAQMRLVVRAGIRPRALCLGAVCDNPDAAEALRTHWGFPVVEGDVRLTVRHDRVRVTAAVDGRPVLEFGVQDPEVIGGADLMTFDNLHLVRVGDDAAGAIVQIDPEYAIHKADRGRPHLDFDDPSALGMGGRIKLVSPIVGFTITADTDLVPPRFVMDPVQPAVQSTRKLERVA